VERRDKGEGYILEELVVIVLMVVVVVIVIVVVMVVFLFSLLPPLSSLVPLNFVKSPSSHKKKTNFVTL